MNSENEVTLAEAVEILRSQFGIERDTNALRQAINNNRKKSGNGLVAVNDNPQNPRRGSLRVTLSALEEYARRVKGGNKVTMQKLSKQTLIIGAANQKGGVTKTTTAAAVATIFGERGFRVLGIDCDPQANFSQQLGVKKLSEEKKVRGTSTDLFELRAHPAEIAVRTECEGVSLIPSSSTLAELEMNLPGKAGADLRLQTALEDCDEYDVVVLDSPPNLGKLSLNVMLVSNFVLIPIDGAWALGSVDTIVEMIKLNTRVYKVAEPDWAVLCVLTQKTNLWNGIREEAKSRYPQNFFSTDLRHSTVGKEAAAMSVPVPLYDKRSELTKDYHKLVDELAIRVGFTHSGPIVG